MDCEENEGRSKRGSEERKKRKGQQEINEERMNAKEKGQE